MIDKSKFVFEYLSDDKIIRVEIPGLGTDIHEMCKHFQDFLTGCGYVINPLERNIELTDVPEEYTPSLHYYPMPHNRTFEELEEYVNKPVSDK